MRVLNVNHTLDPISGGGTAERTFQLSRALVRAGARCDVLTLDLGLTPERIAALSGIGLIALSTASKRFYLPKVSPRQVRDAVEKADVLHLMGHWTVINALVYLAARRLGKPYVICSAGALPVYGRSRCLKMLYNWLVGRRIVRDADGHVAITAGEIPQFVSYGVQPDRVKVVPNGIDVADYKAGDDEDFRRRHSLGDEPFVLFMGRLNRIKGPDLLLKAFLEARNDLPDHRLVFAGPDDGMLSELRKMAARSGESDRVCFIGYLGGEEKSQAYHAAELLAVPSRQEAMSIVALEAGATGTPVLLTDRCGFDEVTQVGGGWVVPATVKGLRTSLVALLKDPVELRRMGSNLHQLVEERYTWGAAITEYLVLYERILEHRAGVSNPLHSKGHK